MDIPSKGVVEATKEDPLTSKEDHIQLTSPLRIVRHKDTRMRVFKLIDRRL